MYREPIKNESKRHVCDPPWPDKGQPPSGAYFECDECGKDYVYSVSMMDWARVSWWHRKKIRASVGLDRSRIIK